MSPALLLSGVALVLLTALHAPVALAQSANANANADRPHAARPPFPQLNLPERKSSGQRAVDLLGARLPEVAAWYRKSPEEFANLLLQDRMLKIDNRGRLFVEDELLAPPPTATASTSTSGLLDGTLAPLDQTFLLHSRPGAKRTVYLNFRGAVLTGTAWNSSGATITALPFDTDGVPYSFSTAELQRIQYIWQRVAEDFAPFEVNVTTEQPSADLLTRSGSGDEFFGTTALITSRSGVYSCSCGGVAYIGVYDDSDYYKPALVFYDALSAGEKNVAEAISHEVGHNIGLNHDGSASSGYYGGHGSGATGWAPIMGVGYYQPLVQWSRGEYATATNVQDDISVIQTNGMPLRTDDHGNSAGAASVMAGTATGGVTTLSGQGVIERSTDIDVFSFATGGGTASFNVLPAVRAANLDVLLSLRNAAGTLLASANPVDALNGTLSASLPAGTYYLWVQGTGKGDPLSTGYTGYGSLGQYALSGSVGSAASQAPVAQISSSALRGTAPWTVSFNGGGSVDPDGSIVSHAWTFGTGGTASGASTSHSFSNPGVYTTTLLVTDNSGLTASSSVTVTVDAPVVVLPMRVADIAMSLKVAKNGNAAATALVTVRDSNGRALPGAVVSGTWSGIVARTGSATSGNTGVASFVSPNTRSRGTFVFTVTGVTLAGHAYNASLNTETSDSITR
jgi:PKD repeat protein